MKSIYSVTPETAPELCILDSPDEASEPGVPGVLGNPTFRRRLLRCLAWLPIAHTVAAASVVLVLVVAPFVLPPRLRHCLEWVAWLFNVRVLSSAARRPERPSPAPVPQPRC